ncbi:MAG: hypothetical protein ACFFAT_13515 [Promethearchaeota archaeon]
MTTSWVPQGKETQAGEKYIEVMREFPAESFEKAVLPLGVMATKEGTKVISIVKVKKGNYESAVTLITKRLLNLSKIEGFRYQVETLLSGNEALSLIGLGIPKQVPM